MTPKSLFGIGECMVELSQAPGGLLRKSFAGDVFNTLWYARKALDDNWATGFATALGTDPVSDEMIAFFHGAGIDTQAIRRIPERRPGLYMIHLDGAERSFSYWRETSAARLLAADRDHIKRTIARADIIYLSGITLAILPDDDLGAMLEALGEAKALVAFDPNIRPALWPDITRMREKIAAAAKVSDIVFPSFDDETAGFGDADPKATLARYAGYGVKTIVVKNGAASVTILSDDTQSEIDTPPVTTPVDTTGAGDSFNGAFLAEYAVSEDVTAAVRAGQACAARVIQHHGALI